MAQANIGSRRACEELIRQGRVKVNGEVIGLGTKADPKADTIVVDGDTLKLENQQKKIYIALNKPINAVSSNRKHKGDDRPTARQLVPVAGHLFTIGRLDAESQGLMIFTNDGELTNRLSHPRYNHTKTYRLLFRRRTATLRAVGRAVLLRIDASELEQFIADSPALALRLMRSLAERVQRESGVSDRR
jgi:23S rRNA pseudouridine2605 synthase